MRGRDIKRYSYDWTGLYLIATFPSLHYDIDKYPAIKNYLLNFGIKRLEQTGKTYLINGDKIKTRKKTNNKWFETQDSIGYWEDFYQPKILWKRVGSILRFTYDEKNMMPLDSTCFAIGINIKYLCCVLNSPMGHYLLKDAPRTGTGDLLISVQAVEPIKIPQIETNINIFFNSALDELLNNCNKKVENDINCKVFDIYNLSESERMYINDNFS